MARGHSRPGERGGGIQRHEGARPLETIQEGCAQLAHGRQGIGIKQGTHPLPPQALAPELQPDRSEPGPTPLLRLVHQERQHPQHGNHHSKRLLARPIVGRKGIALVGQRVEGLIFDLPPGSPTPHAGQDMPFGHPPVGEPADVLDLVLAPLPVLDKSAPHLRVRRLEGDVMEEAQPRHQPGGAVVPCLRDDAPGVLRGLALLEQRGMSAFFPPADRVEIVVLQSLHVRGLGTQPLVGDDTLEVRVVLAQLGPQAFGGMPFTIIFGWASAVHKRRGHERHAGSLGWLDERGAQQRMRIGDSPVAVPPVQTGGTLDRLGRQILCAIQGQEIMASQERQ